MPTKITLQLVLVAALSAIPSCVSVQPARVRSMASPTLTHRPESPPSNSQTGVVPPNESIESPAQTDATPTTRWPARWGAPGAPRGAVVKNTDPAPLLRSAHLGRFHNLRVGEVEYGHADALAKAVGIEDGFRFEPEGPGSLVFQRPVKRATKPESKPEKIDRDDPFETSVFISGTLGEQKNDEDQIAIERTWIAHYDALTDEAKGTIVFIPGMLGTPQPIIEGMIRYWRRAGYSVVRLLSHPSRFTERVEVEIERGDESEVGASLATIFDQRIAECAYACDAGLTHMFELRPELAELPVVLIGMSGGAIVLPTVAAYAPGRYDAAVFIAGGADFLSISATSSYAEWIDAVSIDWEPQNPDSEGKATPERLGLLSESYLAASRLDPMHTAPELGVPALVLHATKDKAVPSMLGDVLWSRLGQPERWVFNVGHELIFVLLPTQADRLQRWIDGAVQGAGADRP
ncbi:MAG: alpha/beta hydrolase family protein [Phycisphaerales bacterium]